MGLVELPLELQDLIFDLAANNSEYSHCLYVHLLRVSKRVYTRLKPKMYNTLVIFHYDCDFHNEDNYALIENIVLVDPILETTERVLPKYFNLKTLRIFDPLHDVLSYITNPSVRLQRLAGSISFITLGDMMMPQLSRLTHLDITNPPPTRELQVVEQALGHLKHLTHLAVEDRGQEFMPEIDRILLNHQQLTIVILCRESVDPEDIDDIQPSQATDTQEADSRLIRLVCSIGYGTSADEDWLAGLYHNRLDKWELAAGLLEMGENEWFKNKKDSIAWINPSAWSLEDLLDHEFGGFWLLTQRSWMWAKHFEMEETYIGDTLPED